MIRQFYQQPFPVIEIDDEFVLREQTFDDTDAFFEYYTDPEVYRYILASNPESKIDASSEIKYCRNLFEGRHGIYWAIARKSDNVMVGAIGYYINNGHHRGEISYDLAKPYWGQGNMTRIISKVVDFGFRSIGLRRVEAVTLEENLASIRVLEKLGFEREGLLKNYRFFKNRSYDVVMLGLTAPMFTPAEERATLHEEVSGV